MKSFGEYIVRIDSLKKNVLAYKKIVGEHKICAVVKADAYGLGIENVVPALDPFVDAFAVANFEEAVKVQKFSNRQILILNFVTKDDILECQKQGFCISISSFTELSIVLNALKNSMALESSPQKIAFAINSGMNRLGFLDMAEFEKCLICLKNNEYKIEFSSIFSHIFNAKNKFSTTRQNRIFMQYVDIAKKHFDLSKVDLHLLASEASLHYPLFRYDMTRPGILLYCNYDGKNKFFDAIEVHSKIVAINKVKKGESVGYSKNFVAKRDMMVATVPIGYADGILRSFSKKGYLLCRGKFCKVVGNICMDMMMIDISKVCGAKLFDKVTLVGKNGKNKISVCQIAKWQNTISYEILTNLKRQRFDVLIAKK